MAPMKLVTCLVSSLAIVACCQAATACDSTATPAGPPALRRPIDSEAARLTSGYGMRHDVLLRVAKLHPGVDWAAPVGTPVTAAAAGRVSAAGYSGAYGNRVVIDHGGPWQTVYAHLQAIDVREGECVMPTASIGRVGTTGMVAGPSLHFEVRQFGRPIDPLTVLGQRVEN